MAAHDERVAGTDVRFHDITEYAIQVQHFGEMVCRPRTQQPYAGADDWEREACCTGV